MPRLKEGHPRKPPATGFRLSEPALERLKEDAARLGLTTSAYLEQLIMESRLVQTDYFAQQAAVSAFTAAALSASIAAKVLGPQETINLQQRGAELSAQMFGASRRRPQGVGSQPEFDDPRLIALFEAFCPR